MSKTTIIFCIDRNPEYYGGFMICLSSLRFWEEENCLPDSWEGYDDQELVERVTKKVGIAEECEGCWGLMEEGSKAPEQVRAELEAEGFLHNKDFSEFINQGWEDDLPEEID